MLKFEKFDCFVTLWSAYSTTLFGCPLVSMQLCLSSCSNLRQSFWNCEIELKLFSVLNDF